MKYIIEIDGERSTRHKYNVWSVFEYESFEGELSKEERIFCSDDQQEFLDFIKTLPTDN